jgi:hypothetical protein
MIGRKVGRMTDWRIVDTEITDTRVRVRYELNPLAEVSQDLLGQPSPAEGWIEVCVPFGQLKDPAFGDDPFGDPERRYLAEIRRSVLKEARSLIGAELSRLQEIAGRQ